MKKTIFAVILTIFLTSCWTNSDQNTLSPETIAKQKSDILNEQNEEKETPATSNDETGVVDTWSSSDSWSSGIDDLIPQDATWVFVQ